ncbi:MAG: PepSY-like domain-containing protein [Chitinophagales bacterium]|nr:PepSY-like domain-containing protein [Chitinophagales bacterium]
MRMILSLLIVAGFAGCADAQKIKESQVPATVVSNLHKMYPNLKDYVWFNEDGNYEAEYKINKMEAAVTYDANGTLMETEREIAVKELPAAVASYISANYSGTEIKEASEITDANGMKSYEAEVKGKDIVFDSNGNFLKEEKD